MLLNFSNHPFSLWSDRQTAAASQYGEIMDIPFPVIDPKANETDIESLVSEYICKIGNIIDPETDAIHVMGEMCFTFRFVKQAQALGYTCLASTTERQVSFNDKGEKITHFEFVQFRKY